MLTNIIIGVTVVVSLLYMNDFAMKGKLMFNPYQVHHNKEWYRFFSSGIIHADFTHLLFNMYSLYIFGAVVEQEYQMLFGNKAVFYFVLLYLSALVVSSMYEFERNKNNLFYNSLGASGAVSAVIFSFIIINPTYGLRFILFPFVDIPAYLFGFIFLGLEYYLAKKGNTNIGHTAHFWGAVHGAVFTIVLKPDLFIAFIQQIRG